MAKILTPETRAPSFSLPSTPDQKVSLEDFRGRNLVLIFYPADWSPVCSDELVVFNELEPFFRKHQTQLVGISCDGAWCHAAFAKDRKLHFPILSDFEPKGATARSYGVYRQEDGVSERALFLIDADGTVRWSYCSPLGVNPGADGVMEALENLNKPAKGTHHEPTQNSHHHA